MNREEMNMNISDWKQENSDVNYIVQSEKGREVYKLLTSIDNNFNRKEIEFVYVQNTFKDDEPLELYVFTETDLFMYKAIADKDFTMIQHKLDKAITAISFKNEMYEIALTVEGQSYLLSPQEELSSVDQDRKHGVLPWFDRLSELVLEIYQHKLLK
ncbi:hypothetical protein [Marinococcus luteus]|uniref:hypothetical protein n=1 Tax=Marinococcus luteus TaxID=1122204 RepID=UPI002ACCD6F3|nr:hypothetical protein [Marinococcus luteus]MDZ5782097.1 hypothetical protein [Marinococcus luteus]